MYAPSERWDLDVFFPGGPTSPAFGQALDAHVAELDAVVADLRGLPPLDRAVDAWRAAIARFIEVGEALWGLENVAHGHMSAHADDAAGRQALGRCQDAVGRLEQVWTTVESALRGIDDALLDALASGPLSDRREHFRHLRAGQALRLEPPLQALLSEADREARYGWGQLYDLLTGPLKARLVRDGEPVELSIGQLRGMFSSPDREVRRGAFEAREAAYGPILEPCAAILTHLTGTRQMRLDRVGADAIAETLHENRIDSDVLDAMWAGVASKRDLLERYLDRKAEALGLDRLAWYDLSAPLGTPPGGSSLTWSEAQVLVVDAFREAEPALADFAVDLLRASGVEAENRPHKRPGAYCMGVTPHRTSRIFMTFSGTLSDAVTLAHELGHAWHNHVLYDAPAGRRQLTMNLAETASTYAESIVRDRLLQAAGDASQQLFMLDQQLQAGTAFLMNIRARYELERDLYRMRREGPLSAETLTEAVLRFEREAYGDRLSVWDPTFWASKLHFFIAEFAFYNWPYTFGYLFSSAIYARARAEGPAFSPVLRELLLRTGWQDCRPLAAEVLGSDLADPAFWEAATAPLQDSFDRFEALLDAQAG